MKFVGFVDSGYTEVKVVAGRSRDEQQKINRKIGTISLVRK